jgi:uncharacterized protein
MPRPLTEPEAQAFLADPHIGVLSVASDNARPPLTVPVWYSYEPGGNLTFFTGTQGRQARKTQLLRQAGVLSFCVQHDEFPYKYVTVEGTVIGIDQPPAAEQVLAIVRRYQPEEMAQGFTAGELAHPAGEFVLFTVRPDRWLSFDFSEEG